MFLPCGERGGGASERLSNWQQLSGEKDKRTPRCQLKFKHSFAMNFMAGGWEGGGANARAESCQCASPPPLLFVPHRPVVE